MTYELDIQDSKIPHGYLPFDISVFGDNAQIGPKDKRLTGIKDPSDIKAFLDQYVMGQEDAKRMVSILLSNHLYISAYNERYNGKDKLKRMGALLTGPTGSGKTYLIETAAKMLNIPVYIVDISRYTTSGYKGNDISDIIPDYLKQYGGHRGVAKGIIFLDEIDKLCGTGAETNVDDFKLHTQYDLLKLVEGGSEDIKNNKLDNLLFVFGGAFTNYTATKTDTSNVMGFNGVRSERKRDKKFNMTAENLIEAGMCQELAGRIGAIATLDRLGKKELKQILTTSKDSVLNQMKRLGEIRGIDLTLSEKEINAIVNKASKECTGARSLRVMAERALQKKMWK